jgi:hypothetical protein
VRTQNRRGQQFEPAKLIAGLVLLAAGVVSLLDAVGSAPGGPGILLLPAVVLGLCCAGLVGALTYSVRRRRARRAERGLPRAGEDRDPLR